MQKLDGVEDLNGGELEGSSMDHIGIDIPERLEKIGGEFRFGFQALNRLAVFDVILVSPIDPFDEVLGLETRRGFAQFLDDNVIGESIIEHQVDHVPGRFREPGDLLLDLIATVNLLGGGDRRFCW